MKKKKIVVFASGGGSNAKKIIEHFSKDDLNIQVALVVSNKSVAPVLDMAKSFGVDTQVVKKRHLEDLAFINEVKAIDPSLIVLAGFLLKVPKIFIESFRNKIINIHPSLLPKFGGKGMYGMNVHRAVIGSREQKTGMTIHWVNENYDEGKVIAQMECEVLDNDKPEDIAAKVLALEHAHYSKTIEKILQNGD